MPASSSPRSKSRRRLWLALSGGAVVVLCLCLLVGVVGGVALYLYRSQPVGLSAVVEYVLDASPRMAQPGESGSPRLTIARAVLAEIVRPADPSLVAGLRIFGSGAVTQSCQDTSLLVPLALSSQGLIADRASALEAGQNTDSALSRAMVAAIRDLAAKKGKHSLVVVTGGADSCNPEAGQVVAQEAQRSGIDLQTYVIGFGVSEAEAQAIKVVTDQTPGARYFDAKDEVALRTTLRGVQDQIEHPAASVSISSTLVSDKDGMTLLYVPAGDFLMGSTDAEVAQVLGECGTCSAEALTIEKPQHTVYLDAYWIDRTDVTNAMYAKCVQAGKCQPPSPTTSATHNSYYGNTTFDNYPVIHVSWNDANAYCDWAGRRLPTEAEWEKAARGTDGRKYPWGNQSPDQTLLNFNQQMKDNTEVGHYPAGASPFGALDMAGNVKQWVADWYGETYYASAPARNPTGPASGSSRVARGGSWLSGAAQVRAASRFYFDPGNQIDANGFRCAYPPSGPSVPPSENPAPTPTSGPSVPPSGNPTPSATPAITPTATNTPTFTPTPTATPTYTPEVFRLSVTKAGSGFGSTVSSNPAGINCGTTCSADYSAGTQVALKAAAATGTTFTGWSGGGCSGVGTCSVTMNAALSVTATFTLNTYVLTVTNAGNGSGSVTSNPAGINCGATCHATYIYSSHVVLTAAAATGSTFTGWSGGGCSGVGTCTVTINAAQSVTANFTLNTYPLTVTNAGNGSGSVTSNPAGINCGDTCSASYNYGTQVDLTAAAAADSTFTGWSGGGCSGTGTCTVTINAAQSVTANFTRTTYPLTVTIAGGGSGSVISRPAGIKCSPTCSADYMPGTRVTLIAAAGPNSAFAGWSGGGCSGVDTCTVTMDAPQSVVANFK
jgi:formylglycine-generating enzyme required for sulfatase activity